MEQFARIKDHGSPGFQPFATAEMIDMQDANSVERSWHIDIRRKLYSFDVRHSPTSEMPHPTDNSDARRVKAALSNQPSLASIARLYCQSIKEGTESIRCE